MWESIKAGIRQRSRDNRLLSMRLTIAEVGELSPGFVRVVLTGTALAEYVDPWPADAFKLVLPPETGASVDAPVRAGSGIPERSGGGGQPIRRAFTVRRFDSATHRLVMDMARHDEGAGMEWLAAARPGDTVSLSGMRPEWAVTDGVRDHVLIGDHTAVPAIAAIIESLGPEDSVSAYVAVSTPGDLELIPPHPNLALHRLEGIDDIVAHTPEPVTAGRRAQVWVAAEAGHVRLARTHITGNWGTKGADLLARAYWRLGTTGTDSDSTSLTEYKKAVARGADLYDPELAEAIDLG